ncbi:MAG: DNA polymerase III subunit alpha, partial [FCB group bacterium]|nr:DNA polymerase III subunit alpha [FCB group bacterium]
GGRIQIRNRKAPEDADAADVSEYLELCAKEGAVNRFGEKPDERTARRLEEELSIIKQMGFPGYFLIVKDFTDFARSQKIAVGPGRGSAAGSLVSYCLGITNIDPMEYGLLFERFLNPERVSMPDIDIDFADDRRGEVISYVRDKYGHDNVTQIITFGKMLARQVVRDVGRVMGFPYAEVDRIAKKIPFMPGMTLEKAMREALDLKELIEANPPYQELMKHCLVLEGLNRNSGTHAAGVVITPGSITDYIPLAKSSEGDTTSQWDMRVLEKMGLLKMDFLGLKTLTVIENTLRLIRERGGNLAIYSIPMNDKKSYELFHQGRTVGVFQFESSGMTEYLKKLKPERLDDLIAMNALYRPGPMQFIDDFIRRKHGKEKIKYIHPKLESILRGTYGVIVYQEQVIQIAHEIAGFSMGKADILRRAMGKKKKDVMESMKQEFIEGVTANGIDNKTGQEIFDLIERFAQYGFNKSHSAGYALVAYQTAYLKAHYPSEFMAATMTSEMSRDSSRFMTLVNECNKIGVEVLPPDVNESEYDFTVSDSRIRFGLGAVKNVGAGPVESIMEAGKRVGRLSDIFEFIQEVDQRLVNRKVLESLIQAGAFDSIDPNRARLFESIDSIISYGNAAHSEKERGQFTFLDSEGGAGRVFMRPQLNSGAIWSDSEKLNREQSVLGYYISGNPLDEFRIEVENFASPPIEGLEGMADGSKVRLCGIMSKVKRQLTKNGDMMAIVSLLDFTGEVETRCFQKGLEQSWNLIGEDAKVVIKGRVSTREDEPVKVLADEIIPLQESLSVFSESLLIRIDLQDFDQGRLNKLETLFRGNSGSFDVNIILSCNGDTVNLKSSRYRVNINKSLLKDLNLLLGDGKVKLGVK